MSDNNVMLYIVYRRGHIPPRSFSFTLEVAMSKPKMVRMPILFSLRYLHTCLVTAKRDGEKVTSAFISGDGKPIPIDDAITRVDKAIADGYTSISSKGLHKS